ncbi:MAG: histidinol dehydrogenase, partial [Candidatus Gastranaerophilaceae bacterium]
MKIITKNEIPEKFFEYKEFENINSVAEIIKDVKERGDEALRDYSKKFGDGEIKNIELSEKEIQDAFDKVDVETKNSIIFSVENVKTFAQAQLNALKEIEIDINGSTLGHEIIPLERTGAYVPGGNYPLPSSAIMSCVPAKVSGVKEVIVCSPKIQPATIVAAKLSGADRIFKVGGVQAIAAMAYGTKSIPSVDKITGPGNKFVTAAKKHVYGVCGIDFLAGPSEVMIIADETANSKFIAADILAQAEHDADASACLITNSKNLANEILENIQKFLLNLQTREIAKRALENSLIILIDDLEDACEIADKKAPEHLEICFKNAFEQKNRFKNYGSLFIGNYSAEVFGDYCSGTNHVLPTNGVARYNGGLSVFDFIKIQTYQLVTENSAKNFLAENASILAKTEGLMAH